MRQHTLYRSLANEDQEWTRGSATRSSVNSHRCWSKLKSDRIPMFSCSPIRLCVMKRALKAERNSFFLTKLFSTATIVTFCARRVADYIVTSSFIEQRPGWPFFSAWVQEEVEGGHNPILCRRRVVVRKEKKERPVSLSLVEQASSIRKRRRRRRRGAPLRVRVRVYNIQVRERVIEPTSSSSGPHCGVEYIYYSVARQSLRKSLFVMKCSLDLCCVHTEFGFVCSFG